MLLSEQELEASSKMDPTIAEFIKVNPSPPFDWEDWQTLRTMTMVLSKSAMEIMGPADPAVMTEEYIDITLRDGFKSTLKVSKPAKAPANGSPLIVFAFGGGWIAGDKDQGTAIMRMFVKAFGAVTVSISYRLAPENPFPCSQLDAWDSLKWIAENASQLGADPKQGFIMSGVSAGGSLASAVVTHAIEEPLAHPFTGQWLAVPTIMTPENCPAKYKKYHLSRQHNVGAPILETKSMASIDKHTQADASSPWRYPVLSSAPIDKQPKAFIMADGMDPLRDDALIWDEVLKDHGVPTRTNFYPGCPHAHWGFFPGIDISNRAVIDLIQGVGWLLGKELTQQDAVARGLS